MKRREVAAYEFDVCGGEFVVERAVDDLATALLAPLKRAQARSERVGRDRISEAAERDAGYCLIWQTDENCPVSLKIGIKYSSKSLWLCHSF